MQWSTGLAHGMQRCVIAVQQFTFVFTTLVYVKNDIINGDLENNIRSSPCVRHELHAVHEEFCAYLSRLTDTSTDRGVSVRISIGEFFCLP